MTYSPTPPAFWFKAIAGTGAAAACLFSAASWLDNKFRIVGPPKSAARHDAFVSDLWTALGIFLGSVILGQLATLFAARDQKDSTSRYWSDRYREEMRAEANRRRGTITASDTVEF